jgi:hypothetical protein
MPRYYFNLSNGDFVPDNSGTPCTTRKDAETYATSIAAEYGRNRDHIPDNLSVCVTDETGREVFRTPVVNHSTKTTAQNIQDSLRAAERHEK